MASETVTEPDFLPSRDGDFQFHVTRPPSLRRLRALRSRPRARQRVSASLNLPGFGTPSGSFFFTASRTVIQPPLTPGTAPSTRMRPRSTSVCITFRLSVVTRSTPRWPGIFLFLKVLPGSWRPPVEPIERCEIGNAVAGPQAAEIPALHAAGEALAGRGAGDVDILADDEMVGRDLGADRNERVVVDAEFGELALGLDLGDGEMAAVGLGRALHLAHAGAELQRHVAVLLFGAMADDLAIAQAQHRDRHMLAGLGEEAGHSDFLCEHPGTHLQIPFARP